MLLSLPGGFALADPIKVAWLNKKFHITPSCIIAGLAARHWLLGVTQVLYVLFICSAGLIAIHAKSVAAVVQNNSVLAGIAASVGFGILFFLSARKLFRGEMARMLWRLFYRLPVTFLRRRLKQFYFIFQETDRQFHTIGNAAVGSLIAVICSYCVFWTVEAFETLLVAHVLGFSIGMMEALMMEALISALKLGMFFLPSGVGAKEVGYVALFSALGINTGNAALAGFIVVKRIVLIGFIVLGYGFLAMQGIRIGPFLKRRMPLKAITES